MEEKLRDYFEEMVVYKDLRNNTGFFSALGLPAFLRDYLLKTFSDDYGHFNMEEVSAFVKRFIPQKEEWMSIKNKIIYEITANRVHTLCEIRENCVDLTNWLSVD